MKTMHLLSVSLLIGTLVMFGGCKKETPKDEPKPTPKNYVEHNGTRYEVEAKAYKSEIFFTTKGEIKKKGIMMMEPSAMFMTGKKIELKELKEGFFQLIFGDTFGVIIERGETRDVVGWVKMTQTDTHYDISFDVIKTVDGKPNTLKGQFIASLQVGTPR